MIQTVVAVVVAYLLGAVPVGLLVARSRGVNIRTVGSGNSGATNVQRTLGWGPGLAVAVFDILKGALAVWVARRLHLGDPAAALCGLAAVMGHNYSAFMGFRGGKGVATSFGVLLMISPLSAGAGFVVGLVTILLTRYVSAGSMIGALTVLVSALLLGRPWWETLILALLTALVFWQHRENMKRLQSGNESRLGQKVAVQNVPKPAR
ncbi:glycerol-3-phosphate 1-O-acyltransferase PlsY [Deinococcus sonorensis]|uniref:Glycerol-3-phosphate acyltransferase n=2 Tax=Deinococcus sonorensis TaxID=309891 RepID=A0AAU7UD71_9DEIO